MDNTCGACGQVSGGTNPYEADSDACTHCGAALPVTLSTPSGASEWVINTTDDDVRIAVDDGPPPSLDVWVRGARKFHHTIATAATQRNDVDARVSMRFLACASGVSAGLAIRDSALGGYALHIDSDGAFSVVLYAANGASASFMVPWTKHEAVRRGLGVTNEVRMDMRGVHLRGWVNGALVCSLYDARCVAGVARVQLDPSGTDTHVVVTHVAIRDADPR